MNTFEYKNKKNKNYFEGWYLRVTDEGKNVNLAFIFAVTKNVDDPHSFIQVYDGIALTSKYYRFDIGDFKFLKETIYIKDNFLSLSSMYLNVGDIEININIENVMNLKKDYKVKSAMSYMSKFPLECFQEVNIIDGHFNGELILKNEEKYISGKAYMEKTYGNKFPTNWIWIQSNHFNKEVALIFAYGKIPLLKWKVKGFLSILKFNGKEYRFGSYNLARLKIRKLSDTQVEIILRRRFHKLVINAKMINPVKLIGPRENGEMNLEVYESINSIATLKFYRGRKVIFDTIGRNVGFELTI